MADIEKLDKIQYKIINELCESISMLGGGSGLLACLGSWGDTLPQDEVLKMLRDWNQGAKEKGWIIQPAVLA